MGLSLLIVVLHYSGLDDTLECLASLGRQSYGNFRTVVIDNGSAERPGKRLATEFPQVEVVELAENLGWSGGNNVGFRLAIARGYDLVCLLNNDTVLPETAVERLVQSAAFLGPCILHPAIDSYFEGDDVQLDPTIPQPPGLITAPVTGRAGVYEINGVNGTCLLVHLDLLKDIGLLDERFFLLYEDADFGRRAFSARHRAFCDAAVRIRHKESRSFGGRRSPLKTYYGMRNVLLFYEKHKAVRPSLMKLGRSLAWTVRSTSEAADALPRSWWGLLCWTLSDDIFARATRMGVRDYLLRRFGRLKRRDEAILVARIGKA